MALYNIYEEKEDGYYFRETKELTEEEANHLIRHEEVHVELKNE